MTSGGTGATPRAAQPLPKSAGRSRNLAAIRRSNTKPEVALRSLLHRRGRRFRKDYRLDLPDARVRPDLVFTRSRVAVFVDGCFWHVCPIHGREPTHNEWYWTPKLRRNVERDRIADAALTKAGWKVVRVWEHVPVQEAASLVEEALKDSLSNTCSTVQGVDRPVEW
ncbi:very short patch repair endonuclease [Blastococcus jejuensis]|uniref:Very short patch repair endonuclease n=1 Tax=Blastococcus jejuensis TaxID=351224 RepID=A0ABP6NWZ3_9ACTN